MAVQDREVVGDPQLERAVLGVFARRLAALSREELGDLVELAKELQREGATQEEYNAARRAVCELLEKATRPAPVVQETPEAVRPERLQKWVDCVAKRVRTLRKAAKMTQEQLADKAGLPQSHISRIETARLAPSSTTIERIAKALGVNANEIDMHRPIDRR